MVGLAIVYFVIAAPLVALAIVMICGRGASLVAGYNTASPAKRAQIDEKKMLRYVGAILLATAAGLVTAGVGAWVGSHVLHYVGIGLLIMMPIVGVIVMNTRDRLKKK